MHVDHLREVANQEITFSVNNCAEGDHSHHCKGWIGMRGDQVALTHSQHRLAFSFEDVTDDGRFRIAVFPDCDREARVAEREDAKPEANPALPAVPGKYTGTPMKAGDGVSKTKLPPATEAEEIPIPESLSQSPFHHCKRFVVPAAVDHPVNLVEPGSSGDESWWRVRLVDGHPLIFSDNNCDASDGCAIRLDLNDQGLLTTGTINKSELNLLGSSLKKITGKVSKTLTPVANTVADAAKQVGSTTKIDALGGKNLYVTAATTGSRLYSTTAGEGESALQFADGIYKNRAVYIKAGGNWANGALNDVKNIAEYLEYRVCVIGLSQELTYGYEAAMIEEEP